MREIPLPPSSSLRKKILSPYLKVLFKQLHLYLKLVRCKLYIVDIQLFVSIFLYRRLYMFFLSPLSHLSALDLYIKIYKITTYVQNLHIKLKKKNETLKKNTETRSRKLHNKKNKKLKNTGTR